MTKWNSLRIKNENKFIKMFLNTDPYVSSNFRYNLLR